MLFIIFPFSSILFICFFALIFNHFVGSFACVVLFCVLVPLFRTCVVGQLALFRLFDCFIFNQIISFFDLLSMGVCVCVCACWSCLVVGHFVYTRAQLECRFIYVFIIFLDFYSNFFNLIKFWLLVSSYFWFDLNFRTTFFHNTRWSLVVWGWVWVHQFWTLNE